jgi:hypothetical protein
LGNLFDPQTPGGGGVIRLTVLGDAIVDGAVVANGEPGPAGGGAGGSIRIDAATLAGAGRIQADGSRGADAGAGGGGGGRIALYATKLDAGLLERTSAAGAKTESEDPAGWGAAGTIFVQREADLLGELIVDNEGTAATQPTELPAVRSGVVDEVGELGFTDREAELAGSLRGMELVFNDDPGLCYMVDGHDRNTFTLQVPDPPLSSRVQPGDTYHGVYRFDRVTVRGGARVLLRGGTRLELRDSHEVGTWNVDPTSSVIQNVP